MSDVFVETESCATYGRRSDDDPQGIDDQWSICAFRAVKDGREIPAKPTHRFGDNDFTGKNADRPDFLRLVQLITSGRAPFRYLYCKDKSRFGRWDDPRTHTYYEYLFESHGVKVIYCNAKEIDYKAPTTQEYGAIFADTWENIKTADERRSFVAKTTEGFRVAVKRGSYPGKRPPYGVKRMIVEDKTGTVLGEAPRKLGSCPQGCSIKLHWKDDGQYEIVQEIFARILQGDSLRTIARSLTARGVATPSGGSRWPCDTILHTARNPLYTGDLIWPKSKGGEPVNFKLADPKGDSPIIYPDFIGNPPVTREQFEMVQRVLEGNRDGWTHRRATSAKYLLSGLVQCACCGFACCGYSSKRHQYYHHQNPSILMRKVPNAESLACNGTSRSIRADALERDVLEAVTSILEKAELGELVRRVVTDRMGPAATLRAAGERRKLDKRLEKKQKSLADSIKRRSEAESDAEKATLSALIATTGREIDSLNEQCAAYKQEEETLAAAVSTAERFQESAVDIRDLLKHGSPHDVKEAIAAVVRRIEWHPGTGEVTIIVRAWN